MGEKINKFYPIASKFVAVLNKYGYRRLLASGYLTGARQHCRPIITEFFKKKKKEPASDDIIL